MGVDVSIQPEIIGHIGAFPLTNSFLTTLIVTGLLVAAALVWRTKIPVLASRVALGARIVVWEILKFIDSATGDREFSRRVFPIVATFFIFIVTANMLELVPGFLGSFYVVTSHGNVPLLRSPNSDINTTIALAIVAVTVTQYFTIKVCGVWKYLGRFFNFRSPALFVTGFFELMSEAIKLVSFSFRLFGNVFAGEVLLIISAFFLPYILPLPFMIIEIFVGTIQAFIFAILSLTFIRTAIAASERESG